MVTLLPSTATRPITVLTAEVGTILTIIAPDEIIQGQSFRISGALRRVDTSQLLVGETISASFNGTSVGGDVTGSDGSYNIDAVINEVGFYTLTSNFAGSTRPGLTLGASEAKRGLSVSMPTPLTAIVSIVLPIAIGLIVAKRL